MRLTIAIIVAVTGFSSVAGDFFGGLEGRNRFRFPSSVRAYFSFNGGDPGQTINNGANTNHFGIAGSSTAPEAIDPTYTATGRSGGGFDFERDNAERITVNDATIDNDWVTLTWACWAKIETPFVLSQAHDILSNRGAPADSGAFLRVNPNIGGTATNRLEWIVKDLNNVFTERRYEQVPPGVADLSEFTHYAATFFGAGSPHGFLINGDAGFTLTLDQIPGANYKPVTQEILFGHQAGGGADADAVIDEVWIMSQALTTNQMYRIFLQGFDGNSFRP